MDQIFTRDDQDAALAQGWGLFSTEEVDTPVQLRRCERVGRFQSDFHAWCFVARQAFIGCPVARRALTALKNESTFEFAAIRLMVDGLGVR